MNINKIRIINFRNYLNSSLKLNKNMNVFIGKNGQGKTNLLESIYFSITGKSFKTNSDREMINLEKDEAYVGAYANIGPYERLIEIKLERNNPKTLRINKNVIKDSEFNSGLNVVVFTPDDLNLVKDGPSKRRSFLDREISQIRPLYQHNLSRYNRILYQRNNILKTNKSYEDKKELLELFNIQLVEVGSHLIYERVLYIKDISKIAKRIHGEITLEKEVLDINYEPSFKLGDTIKEIKTNYMEALSESLDRDLRNMSTNKGPHRDDMKMSLNDKDLRTYGSQGQQRTAVLSIKLSEVELIKMERGHYPILLLDDVFSELDNDRRKYLIKSFKDLQTMITIADTFNSEEMKDVDKSIFVIENGTLKGEKNYDTEYRE